MMIPRIGIGTYPLHGAVLKDIISVASSTMPVIIDTAVKYENESDIGTIIKTIEDRSNVWLESKVLPSAFVPGMSIESELRGSCARLGVEKLDCYLLHERYDCETRYGELLRCREKGLVDWIGVCRMGVSHIDRIKNLYGEYPMINQIEMHPFYSNKKVLDKCREGGVIVEARSPFAHGDILGDLLSCNALQEIAARHKKSIPQVVLRWILQCGAIPVSRTTNVIHLKENLDIFDFELSATEMSEIDSLNQGKSYGFVSAKLS